MEQQNYWLTTELTRQRYEGLRQEADHRHLLEAHGLDLWSVVVRAVRERLPRRPVVRSATFASPTAELETPERVAA